MSEHSRLHVIENGPDAYVTLPADVSHSVVRISPPVESTVLTSRPLVLEAAPPPPKPLDSYLHPGAIRRPDGLELTADSRSLLLNSRPWLPVMGEFHYARYPEAEQRSELLRLKAGGIDIVATYVFWIHHEEMEGRWDWSGRRCLRDFIRLCAEVDLSIIVRCGPWCHGEVRNGGLPDWLLRNGCRLRSDDPGYLAPASRLYFQIAQQIRGLLWKEGGPVIGIQLENEYGGPAEHLLTLKRLARETGIDVPLYTYTGWPGLATPLPPGEMLPLFGSYAEGFWDRELTPMPGGYGNGFRFMLTRGETTAAIGTDQLGSHRPQESDDDQTPYLCCEIGGGMETSYHRRIKMDPADVEAASLVKIGSGNNLQGYYIYHGGTNPEGKLSTLQESQRTNYWNDLPVKSYDYQAPLGEFGQIRPHYHRLRLMHLFLHDWGAELATQPAKLPCITPDIPTDATTLRWTARTDGRSGFVFVNNYQRLQPMPAKEGVQFQLHLRTGDLLLPETPFTAPADSTFFWPFNLDLGGATLIYATAQPVCRLEDRGTKVVVFAQTAGVPPEFIFDGRDITVEHTTGRETRTHDRLAVHQIQPGTAPAVRLRTAHGPIDLMLLDEAQSLACWKGVLLGRERLFLTDAGLIPDRETLSLTASAPTDLTVAIFPPPSALIAEGMKVMEADEELFRRYTVSLPQPEAVEATVELARTAGPARTVPIGSQGVAEAPEDEDFAQAAVWRIKLPEETAPARDLLLRIRYIGDVARLYSGDVLLTDNFYNGRPFEVGLKRYAPEIYGNELRLEILPLRKEAPLYLPPDARPDFGEEESVVQLIGVEVDERHTVHLHAC